MQVIQTLIVIKRFSQLSRCCGVSPWFVYPQSDGEVPSFKGCVLPRQARTTTTTTTTPTFTASCRTNSFGSDAWVFIRLSRAYFRVEKERHTSPWSFFLGVVAFLFTRVLKDTEKVGLKCRSALEGEVFLEKTVPRVSSKILYRTHSPSPSGWPTYTALGGILGVAKTCGPKKEVLKETVWKWRQEWHPDGRRWRRMKYTGWCWWWWWWWRSRSKLGTTANRNLITLCEYVRPMEHTHTHTVVSWERRDLKKADGKAGTSGRKLVSNEWMLVDAKKKEKCWMKLAHNIFIWNVSGFCWMRTRRNSKKDTSIGLSGDDQIERSLGVSVEWIERCLKWCRNCFSSKLSR